MTKDLSHAGAPTLYKESYNKDAYKLTMLGLKDTQLAEYFEVSEDTIYEWKKTHKKFSEAVKKGKKIADAKVAVGLYKRACGYSYTETTNETKNTPQGPVLIEKTVVKEIPPDPGAAMNWLKNRQPDIWRDKQQVEHSGKVDGEIVWLIPNAKKDEPELPEAEIIP